MHEGYLQARSPGRGSDGLQESLAAWICPCPRLQQEGPEIRPPHSQLRPGQGAHLASWSLVIRVWSFQVLELQRVSLRAGKLTTRPVRGRRAVRLSVHVKPFLRVALVGRSRQAGMDSHRHRGRGCHRGNRSPVKAVLHKQSRAAVALLGSPLWLRPSAVLQMGGALRGPSRDVSSVPGQVLFWWHIGPLEVVLLLLLGFIPACHLGSKGKTVECACCIVLEGFHHLQEMKCDILPFKFNRTQKDTRGFYLTFSLGKLGFLLASSNISDVGLYWLLQQDLWSSVTPDVGPSEYSEYSEKACLLEDDWAEWWLL